MHSLGQRQGKRHKYALMRNELCYLCYLPPQLCPAGHNDVVATIDAVPQFTELMEWVSKSVTYFLHSAPRCTQTHAQTHSHTYKYLPTHPQSYSIKSYYLSYEEGQKHQRSKQQVRVLGGNFIMSLCRLAAFICQWWSSIVSQKHISSREEEWCCKSLKCILHTENLVNCTRAGSCSAELRWLIDWSTERKHY